MSGAAADWNGIKKMGLEEKLPSGFLLTTVENRKVISLLSPFS